MGVPVVSLAGKSHRSRVGVSLLKTVGYEELIADTPQQYVALAAELAQDEDRRRTISRELRHRMLDSSLTRGREFASNLEAAFRRMCDGTVA